MRIEEQTIGVRATSYSHPVEAAGLRTSTCSSAITAWPLWYRLSATKLMIELGARLRELQ